MTSLVHRISTTHPFVVTCVSATSPRSASDLPNRMELQINPPRLQMLTSSSADLASLRYLCVIATEASNLLPLFTAPYSYPHSLPSIRCFRSVAATTLACLLHFISYQPLASSNSTVLLCGSGGDACIALAAEPRQESAARIFLSPPMPVVTNLL